MILGYAYVVGDILHLGHIQFLRNCKALCDKLVVGVLTDGAVMEEKPRPTIPFEDRIRMVGELKCVDAVVSQDHYDPIENVMDIKPDILFESSSHRDPCYNPYGRTVIWPYFWGQSSTQIKEKVREEEDEGCCT